MGANGYVLIVEDERDLALLIDYNVRQAGFATRVAHTGEQALAEARREPPRLVLLDLMLPDIPGTELCRTLKRDPTLAGVPVIMLTARGEELDRVVGFELGADDYMTKPFSLRELVLRIHAVLRRRAPVDPAAATPASDLVQLGPLRLDLPAHRCEVAGAPVELTALEFRLLRLLIERAGRVQSRATLLEDVWEVSQELETRTVDTHVKRLREKLGPARDWLETVRGVGYRLRSPAP